MNIIENIKKFVENECKKPTSKYWFEPFYNHFEPVVNYALELQSEFWWDKEVIEISAWLHDIWSIIYWREDHHITWAKIAEEKLIELKYEPEKIDLVKKCILNHRWSQDNIRESIEEKILAEADILSNFDNLPWIFMAAFIYENKNQSEARESALKKLKNKRNQLHFEKSRKIIRPKYEAALLLLNKKT